MLNGKFTLEDGLKVVNQFLSACVTTEEVFEYLDILERRAREERGGDWDFVDMMFEHALELAPMHLNRIEFGD